MDERSFPPPSFPTSLNVFYQSSPKNFKEKETSACDQQETRDFISKQILLKSRFPRLEINSNRSSLSPAKVNGFMTLTGQFKQKLRSISPVVKPRTFVPCNQFEAKKISMRKVSIFDGNPFNDQREMAFKEYQENVRKRLGGEFKRAMKNDFLADNQVYINSRNTFETFTPVSTEGKTGFSISLIK